MATKGQWVKVTGGDAGAYFDGREWIPFECIGCMFARGILDPNDRVSIPAAKRGLAKLEGRANNPKYVRHDRNIHNEWIKAGKPTGRTLR